MNCSKCNTPLADEAQFCNQCGAPRPTSARFCNQCGAPLPAQAQFCSQCGSPAATLPQADSAPDPQEVTALTERVLAQMTSPFLTTTAQVKRYIERLLQAVQRPGITRSDLKAGINTHANAERACKALGIAPTQIPMVNELSIYRDIRDIENNLATRWTTAKKCCNTSLLEQDLAILANQGLVGLFADAAGVVRDRWERVLQYKSLDETLDQDYVRTVITFLLECGRPLSEPLFQTLNRTRGETVMKMLLEDAQSDARAQA